MNANLKNESNKSTKINILGALIIVMSIIIIAISGSYAFFMNEVEHENLDNEGIEITSGDLKMKFESTSYIQPKNMGLIDAITDDNADNSTVTVNKEVLDKDKDTNKNYTDFTVSIAEDSTINSAKYNLFLTDVKISKNFKSKYLKWALFEGGVQKAVGDFSNVTLGSEAGEDSLYTVSENIPLLENVDISNSASDSYVLYVWLEDDASVNQANECNGSYDNCVDLRSGSLNMKVGFRAVTSSN